MTLLVSVEYNIEPFGPAIADAYSRLFAGDPDKNAAMLDWRFAQNPHGPARFVVARQDGRIHGLIALVPTRLTSNRESLDGWQAIDTIVDPDLRGKFVFVRLGKLAEDFVAGQGGVLWGFPNASAARGWFGRLGWTRTGSAPFLIRPLRSGYALKRLLPSLARLDVRLYRRRNGIGVRPPADVAEWPDPQPNEWTSVDRNPAWMRWRLARPGAGYRMLSDDAGQSAILRIEEKHGGRVAYLMDARGADERKLGTLIRDALAWAGDQGADVALAWCAEGAPTYRAHRKAGFLPFPDRLRPIEIHHGYWQADDEAGARQALGAWDLSYLDSDTV